MKKKEIEESLLAVTLSRKLEEVQAFEIGG